MQTEIKGVKLHWEQWGQGDKNILMLHGWGCSIKHFEPIAKTLENDYHVTVIDFPAHGESGQPPEPWGVGDFAACTQALIEKLHIAPCDIIAHSFGGRVALWLAANEPQLVNRLVLTGCAGLRKPQTEEQKKKSERYQKLKKLLAFQARKRRYDHNGSSNTRGTTTAVGRNHPSPTCEWSKQASMVPRERCF